MSLNITVTVTIPLDIAAAIKGATITAAHLTHARHHAITPTGEEIVRAISKIPFDLSPANSQRVPKPFFLTVEKPARVREEILVTGDTTLKEIGCKIERVDGVARERMRLIYDKRWVWRGDDEEEDERETLDELGIGSNSVVYLILRRSGS